MAKKKSKQLELVEHIEVTDEDRYLKSLVLQRTILRTKLNNIEKEIQALEK